MIKINLSTKTKRILLAALWVLVVVILYITYNYLSNKKDAGTIPEPIVYHELDFDYPVTWSKDSKSYDNGDIDHDVYNLTSENDDFGIEIEYRVENLYKEEVGLSFYPSEAITNVFKEEDFEIISSNKGNPLLASRTGAEKVNIDGILGSSDIVIGKQNYVYQEYEDGLSLVISSLIDPKTSVPVGYTGITISYTFNTQEAIDKWPEYKEILKSIVYSLEVI